MTILGYPIGQVRKAVASFIFLLGSVAVLVVSGYDPDFTNAVVALSGSVIGVVTVFMTANHTVGDLSKAAAQLQASALFVVGFFATVDPNTAEQITVIVGSLLAVFAVYKFRNGDPEPGPA